MNTITIQEAWSRLQQRGLVEGEQPAADTQSSPWYVRVMLGIAGWMGAGFLLGFVGVAFAFAMENAFAAILIGALCCGGAYAIFRAARSNDFLAQFGLAVSFSGQFMVIYGIFKAFGWDSVPAFLVAAAFEAALTVLVPNVIHRVLSAGGAMLALAFGMERFGLFGVSSAIAAAVFAMVWLDQARWAGKGELWRPVGYGLALALLYLESTRFFGFYRYWMHGDPGWLALHGPLIGFLLLAVVCIWASVRLLEREGIPLASATGMASLLAAVLVVALSYFAPGVATASLILLLGFACGNRILMGLGLVALLGFVSHYYYQMQSTLLVKSGVLAATGAALLLARLALHHYFPSESAEENAHA